jgi:unsaturated rhamnogalacturonyl hydrolase
MIPRFLHRGAALASAALFAIGCLPVLARAADPVATVPKVGGATPMEWAVRLARSEMDRRGDRMFYQEGTRARWEYTHGLFSYALVTLGNASGQGDILDYGERLASTFVTPEGQIRTFRKEEYNIDLIPPGRTLYHLYRKTGDARYQQAIEVLMDQLHTHPRTSEGGFWHKQRYPYQMWLDGLYMGSPFLAEYAVAFNKPEHLEDVVLQIKLMDRHSYDAAKGLHYHAWDEKRAQDWANKETGCSPNFWSRSIGWYGMALVDCLDYIPATQEDGEFVVSILRRVADGIVRYQDPKTGLWWQVTDQGDRKGNYLESTASSMFVYILAKGINNGYLPRDTYLPALQKGYEGIIRDFIREDGKGRIDLTQCCEVAGLGYTNSKGMKRDGSFDYYVSEPIISNDLKGVGPFLFAGVEMEKLLANLGKPQPLVVTGWESYPAVLARIKAPTFPDRDFPITQFGAPTDGKGDSTDAIRKAIAACHAAGGGRVVVPKGTFVTGAIHLLSNVNLHVSEGATLLFDAEPSRMAKNYPVVFTRWEGVECMNYSPLIYAWEQENIAITGKGTLDGGATLENWWAWNDKDAARAAKGPTKQKADRDKLFDQGERGVPVHERVYGPGHYLRPNFIQPYRCRNILIEGVTIVRSPMWELNPVLSQNITVRGLTITSHGPNNDGCDPESCQDVLIEDTLFDTGDDCIAIKSGRNNDGRRVGVPTENVIVRRCTMKDGHGGVVLGSEISGGVRNVFIEDCVMDSPNLDRALRFKNNAVRGGVLENVFMRRVKVGRVAEAVLTIDLLYEEGAKGAHKPVVRNVQIEDVTSSGSPRVMFIAGFEGAIIDNIRFKDCTFNGVEQAEVVSGIGTFSFRNVTINPAKKVRAANSPTAATAGN